MEPVTPIETLCRIILRAREYEAQVPTDYDGGEAADNIDGADGDTLSVLDDEVNSGIEEELTAAFDDLAEDQLVEVLAFCWVGQGTYEAAEWDEAIEEAGERDQDRRRTDGHADARLGPRSGHGRVRHHLRRRRRPQLAPAERIAPPGQPRPTGIMVIGQPAERERARLEAGGKPVVKRARLGRGDLVLDGDVRPPAVAVLLGQMPAKRIGKLGADRIELVRDDPESNSSA